MMRLLVCAVCVCVLVGVGWCANLVSEQEPVESVWFRGKEEGWFFYRDPVEEELVKEVEPLQQVQERAEAEREEEKDERREKEVKEEKKGPHPLTVEWFRAHYDEILRRAIDDPTPENVAAYLFVQRVILDKATNFAYAVRNVVQSEPLLDENVRIPLVTAMRAAFLREREKRMEEALRYLAGRAGVWFFFRSDCRFCEWQYPLVKEFCDRYGFYLMPVSMDGGVIESLRGERVWPDTGQSRRLGIMVVPAVVLAVPDRAEVLIVAQGAVSLEGLEQRIIAVAMERGLLPGEFVREIDIFRRGVLTPEQIKSVPDEDDPVKLVNFIRRELEKAWGYEAGGMR